MRVKITQKEIDCGRNSMSKCPIALALKRDGHKDVFVGFNHAKVGKKLIELSPEAKAFVHNFDRGLPVAEGQIEL